MIKLGDVLFRYLPEYQVWHVGIVIRMNEKYPGSLHHVYLLEFDDSDAISEVSLYNFLWNRKYFWVTNFDEELKHFGPKVFRTTRERIQTAFDLFNANQLKYTLHKYNCEYFARRCVFSDSGLWASKQTMSLGRSRLALYSKLISIAVFSVIHKIHNDIEFEKDMRPTDKRYMAHDGRYMP
jgi:hypothetical protein